MNIAFVLFGDSEIGGADKRFGNLFNSLKDNNEHNFYFIISLQKSLSIKNILKDFEHPNIIIQNAKSNYSTKGIRGTYLYTAIKTTKSLKWLKTFKSYIIIWIDLIRNSLFLYHAIRKYKIDIVHTLWKGSFTASFLKLFYNKFYHVMTYMDVYCDRVSRNILDIPLSYNLSLLKADHIDFLGESYLNELKKLNFTFKDKKTSISPNSFINMIPFSESEKENIVIFAGRFASKKNPFLFIEAAQEIFKKRNDIKFEMYGKGDLDAEIREFVKTKKLTNKILIEYTEEIEKKFLRSKVFISLQEVDNYPSQAILEAMFLRNVVIATNTGETEKLVTQATGYLVGFNPVEIAQKIEEIIDNPIESKLMADNANNFITQNHSIEKFREYILGIYGKFA